MPNIIYPVLYKLTASLQLIFMSSLKSSSRQAQGPGVRSRQGELLLCHILGECRDWAALLQKPPESTFLSKTKERQGSSESKGSWVHTVLGRSSMGRKEDKAQQGTEADAEARSSQRNSHAWPCGRGLCRRRAGWKSDEYELFATYFVYSG